MGDMLTLTPSDQAAFAGAVSVPLSSLERGHLPITLTEAVLGARVKTPTPTGAVMLTVPKGSSTGTMLRLKGKGVARRGGHGDELVKLKVMLPSEPNAELEAFVSTWSSAISDDPRKDMV